MDTIILLAKAVEIKPKYGDACNNCGYCCLAETCVVGQEITGEKYGRCKLLITDGDKHYCKLGTDETARKVLGIGEGCCAKTQSEVIAEYVNNY